VDRYDHVPRVALAVYAHPDDADVAAGGTLAAWSSTGCSTHLLIVCDGAKGSEESENSLESIRQRRATELDEAAQLIGASSVTTLGRSDGEFANDEKLRGEIVAVVRRLRPESVLGPDPTAVFFGGVYVNHRDHREVGWALLDAVAPASAMPLYFPESGPPHAVTHLLLSGTHEADVVVDVTAVMDHKVSAILAHGSQLSGDPDGVRAIISDRARASGREIGVAYGESFRHVALAH
jgi:LmbE family N-acetylglucosaminyl deacetylase